MSRKTVIPLLILTVLFAACSSKPKPEPRRYELEGKIVGVDAGAKKLTVAHKDIPGFMNAMTMDFKVRDANVFSYARKGDQISAILVMDPDGSYLDDVVIVQNTPDSGASTSPVHLPQVGDQVPDFTFTNQSGKKDKLSALHGRPVLLTFIYTRCPLPDYCVRMSSNFADIEKQLKQNQPKLYDKLQLVSVSIDPEFDTAKVLKAYGKNYVGQVDPNFTHWWFVSSSPDETKTFANFFGLSYMKEQNQIVHSLRTALVGPDGKIAAIYNGNDWRAGDAIKDLQGMK